MYDSTCKFIALEYSRDLTTWLLGKPLELTEIKPSELWKKLALKSLLNAKSFWSRA
ncbi:hypothetical protein MICAE_3020002 [Microcystis aeruginosa PCC 9806]|uniref:Uncharacterized protein n=1 Tax=Microcystis aeruginosa PCC 9806 TaxID=1160282 RepID=I4GXL7_MICAE|nr:hypothetical protein MICAE_3020002 [Microcystis aeruginosa PCC 9806]